MNIFLVILHTLFIQKISFHDLDKANDKQYENSEKDIWIRFVNNAATTSLEKRTLNVKEKLIKCIIKRQNKTFSVLSSPSSKLMFNKIVDLQRIYNILILSYFNFIKFLRNCASRSQQKEYKTFRGNNVIMTAFLHIKMLVHTFIQCKFYTKRKSNLFLEAEFVSDFSYLKSAQVLLYQMDFTYRRFRIKSYLHDVKILRNEIFCKSSNKITRKRSQRTTIYALQNICFHVNHFIFSFIAKSERFCRLIKILQRMKIVYMTLEYFQLYTHFFHSVILFVICLLRFQIEAIFYYKRRKNFIIEQKIFKSIFLLAKELIIKVRETKELIMYIHPFFLQIKSQLSHSKEFITISKACFHFSPPKAYISFIFKKALLIYFILSLVQNNSTVVCAKKVSKIHNSKEYHTSHALSYLNAVGNNQTYEKYNDKTVFTTADDNFISSYELKNDINNQDLPSIQHFHASSGRKKAFKSLLYYNIISSRSYKSKLKYNAYPSCIKNIVYQMAKELSNYQPFSTWNSSHLLQRFDSKKIHITRNRYLQRYIILLIKSIAKYANNKKLFEKYQVNTLATLTSNYLIRPLTVHKSCKSHMRNEEITNLSSVTQNNVTEIHKTKNTDASGDKDTVRFTTFHDRQHEDVQKKFITDQKLKSTNNSNQSVENNADINATVRFLTSDNHDYKHDQVQKTFLTIQQLNSTNNSNKSIENLIGLKETNISFSDYDKEKSTEDTVRSTTFQDPNGQYEKVQKTFIDDQKIKSINNSNQSVENNTDIKVTVRFLASEGPDHQHDQVQKPFLIKQQLKSTNNSNQSMENLTDLKETNINFSDDDKSIKKKFSFILEKELSSSNEFLRVFNKKTPYSDASGYAFSMSTAFSNSPGFENMKKSDISIAFERALQYLGANSTSEDYSSWFSFEIAKFFSEKRIISERSWKTQAEDVAKALLQGLSPGVSSSNFEHLKVYSNKNDRQIRENQFEVCELKNSTLLSVVTKDYEKIIYFLHDSLSRDKAEVYFYEIMNILKSSFILNPAESTSFIDRYEKTFKSLSISPTRDDYIIFLITHVKCLVEHYGIADNLIIKTIYDITLKAIISEFESNSIKNDYCRHYGIEHEKGDNLAFGKLLCNELVESFAFRTSFEGASTVEVAAYLFSIAKSLKKAFSFISESAISVSFVTALHNVHDHSDVNVYASAFAYEIAKLFLTYKSINWVNFEHRSKSIAKIVISALPQNFHNNDHSQKYKTIDRTLSNTTITKVLDVPLTNSFSEDYVKFKSIVKQQLLTSTIFNETFNFTLSRKAAVNQFEIISNYLASVEEFKPLRNMTFALSFFKDFQNKFISAPESFASLIATSIFNILSGSNYITSSTVLPFASKSAEAVIQALEDQKAIKIKEQQQYSAEKNFSYSVLDHSNHSNHSDSIKCLHSLSTSLYYNLLSSNSVYESLDIFIPKNTIILLNCTLNKMISNEFIKTKNNDFVDLTILTPRTNNMTSDALKHFSYEVANIWCSSVEVRKENYEFYSTEATIVIIQCIKDILTTDTLSGKMRTTGDENDIMKPENNTSCFHRFSTSLHYNLLSSKQFREQLSNEKFIPKNKTALLKCVIHRMKITKLVDIDSQLKSNFLTLPPNNNATSDLFYNLSKTIADIWCSNFGINLENFEFYATDVTYNIIHCVKHIVVNEIYLVNARTKAIQYSFESLLNKSETATCIYTSSISLQYNILTSKEFHKYSHDHEFIAKNMEILLNCIINRMIVNKSFVRKNQEEFSLVDLKVDKNNVTVDFPYHLSETISHVWCNYFTQNKKNFEFYSAEVTYDIVHCLRQIVNDDIHENKIQYVKIKYLSENSSNENTDISCTDTVSKSLHYNFISSKLLPEFLFNDTFTSLSFQNYSALVKCIINGMIKLSGIENQEMSFINFTLKIENKAPRSLQNLSETVADAWCSKFSKQIDNFEIYSEKASYAAIQCIKKAVEKETATEKPRNIIDNPLNNEQNITHCTRAASNLLRYNLLSSKKFKTLTHKDAFINITDVLTCLENKTKIYKASIIESNGSVTSNDFKLREGSATFELSDSLSDFMADIWCSSDRQKTESFAIYLTDITYKIIGCTELASKHNVYVDNIHIVGTNDTSEIIDSYKRDMDCFHPFSALLHYNFISSKEYLKLPHFDSFITKDYNALLNCILKQLFTSTLSETNNKEKSFNFSVTLQDNTSNVIQYLFRNISEIWCSTFRQKKENFQFYATELTSMTFQCINQLKGNETHWDKIKTTKEVPENLVINKNLTATCNETFSSLLHYNLLSSKSISDLLSIGEFSPETQLALLNCIVNKTLSNKVNEVKYFKNTNITHSKLEPADIAIDLPHYLSEKLADILCVYLKQGMEYNESYLTEITFNSINCIKQVHKNKYNLDKGTLNLVSSKNPENRKNDTTCSYEFSVELSKNFLLTEELHDIIFNDYLIHRRRLFKCIMGRKMINNLIEIENHNDKDLVSLKLENNNEDFDVINYLSETISVAYCSVFEINENNFKSYSTEVVNNTIQCINMIKSENLSNQMLTSKITIAPESPSDNKNDTTNCFRTFSALLNYNFLSSKEFCNLLTKFTDISKNQISIISCIVKKIKMNKLLEEINPNNNAAKTTTLKIKKSNSMSNLPKYLTENIANILCLNFRQENFQFHLTKITYVAIQCMNPIVNRTVHTKKNITKTIKNMANVLERNESFNVSCLSVVSTSLQHNFLSSETFMMLLPYITTIPKNQISIMKCLLTRMKTDNLFQINNVEEEVNTLQVRLKKNNSVSNLPKCLAENIANVWCFNSRQDMEDSEFYLTKMVYATIQCMEFIVNRTFYPEKTVPKMISKMTNFSEDNKNLNLSCLSTVSSTLQNNFLSSSNFLGLSTNITTVSKNELAGLKCILNRMKTDKLLDANNVKSNLNTVAIRLKKNRTISNLAKYLSENIANVWCLDFRQYKEDFAFYVTKITIECMELIAKRSDYPDKHIPEITKNMTENSEDNKSLDIPCFSTVSTILEYNFLSSKRFLGLIPRISNVPKSQIVIVKCLFSKMKTDKLLGVKNFQNDLNAHVIRLKKNSTPSSLPKYLSENIGKLWCWNFNSDTDDIEFFLTKVTYVTIQCMERYVKRTLYEAKNMQTRAKIVTVISDNNTNLDISCLSAISARLQHNFISSEPFMKLLSNSTTTPQKQIDIMKCILNRLKSGKLIEVKNFTNDLNTSLIRLKKNNTASDLSKYFSENLANIWCLNSRQNLENVQFYLANVTYITVQCMKPTMERTVYPKNYILKLNKDMTSFSEASKSLDIPCFSTVSYSLEYNFLSSKTFLRWLPNITSMPENQLAMVKCVFNRMKADNSLKEKNLKDNFNNFEIRPKKSNSTLNLPRYLAENIANVLCSNFTFNSEMFEFYLTNITYITVQCMKLTVKRTVSSENYILKMNKTMEKFPEDDKNINIPCFKTLSSSLEHNFLSSKTFLGRLSNITTIPENQLYIVKCIFNRIKTEKLFKINNVENFKIKLKKSNETSNLPKYLAENIANVLCLNFTINSENFEFYLTNITDVTVECIELIEKRTVSSENNIWKLNKSMKKIPEGNKSINISCFTTFSKLLEYNFLSSNAFPELLPKIKAVPTNQLDIVKCALRRMKTEKLFDVKNFKNDINYFAIKLHKNNRTSNLQTFLAENIANIWCLHSRQDTENFEFYVTKVTYVTLQCMQVIAKRSFYSENSVSKMTENITQQSEGSKIINAPCFSGVTISLEQRFLSSKTFISLLPRIKTVPRNQLAIVKCVLNRLNSDKLLPNNNDINVISIRLKRSSTSSKFQQDIAENIANVWCSNFRESPEYYGIYLTDFASIALQCMEHIVNSTITSEKTSLKTFANATENLENNKNSFDRCFHAAATSLQYNLLSSRYFRKLLPNVSNIPRNQLAVANCVLHRMEYDKVFEMKKLKKENKPYSIRFKKGYITSNLSQYLAENIAKIWCLNFNKITERFVFYLTEVTYITIECAKYIVKRSFYSENINENMNKSSFKNISNKESTNRPCFSTVSTSLEHSFLSSNTFLSLLPRIKTVPRNQFVVVKCVLNRLKSDKLLPDNNNTNVIPIRLKKSPTSKLQQYLIENIANVWCSNFKETPEHYGLYLTDFASIALQCMEQIVENAIDSEKTNSIILANSTENSEINKRGFELCFHTASIALQYNFLSTRYFRELLPSVSTIPRNQIAIANCVLHRMEYDKVFEMKNIKKENKPYSIKFKKGYTTSNLSQYLAENIAKIWCLNMNEINERFVFYLTEVTYITIECVEYIVKRSFYSENINANVAECNTENANNSESINTPCFYAVSTSLEQSFLSSKTFLSLLPRIKTIPRNQLALVKCVLNRLKSDKLLPHNNDTNVIPIRLRKSPTSSTFQQYLTENIANVWCSNFRESPKHYGIYLTDFASIALQCMEHIVGNAFDSEKTNPIILGNLTENPAINKNGFELCFHAASTSLQYNFLSTRYFRELLPNVSTIPRNQLAIANCVLHRLEYDNVFEMKNVNKENEPYPIKFKKCYTTSNLSQYLAENIAKIWCLNFNEITERFVFYLTEVTHITIECVGYIIKRSFYSENINANMTESSTENISNNESINTSCFSAVSTALEDSFLSSKTFLSLLPRIKAVPRNQLAVVQCLLNRLNSDKLLPDNNDTNVIPIQLKKCPTFLKFQQYLTENIANVWCSNFRESPEHYGIYLTDFTSIIHQCMEHIVKTAIDSGKTKPIILANLTDNRESNKNDFERCFYAASISLQYNFLSTRYLRESLPNVSTIPRNQFAIANCVLNRMDFDKFPEMKNMKHANKPFLVKFKKGYRTSNLSQYLAENLAKIWCLNFNEITERLVFYLTEITHVTIECVKYLVRRSSYSESINANINENSTKNINNNEKLVKSCSFVDSASLQHNFLSSQDFQKLLPQVAIIPKNQMYLVNCTLNRLKTDISHEMKNFKIKNLTFPLVLKKSRTVSTLPQYLAENIANALCLKFDGNIQSYDQYLSKATNVTIQCMHDIVEGATYWKGVNYIKNMAENPDVNRAVHCSSTVSALVYHNFLSSEEFNSLLKNIVNIPRKQYVVISCVLKRIGTDNLFKDDNRTTLLKIKKNNATSNITLYLAENIADAWCSNFRQNMEYFDFNVTELTYVTIKCMHDIVKRKIYTDGISVTVTESTIDSPEYTKSDFTLNKFSFSEYSNAAIKYTKEMEESNIKHSRFLQNSTVNCSEYLSSSLSYNLYSSKVFKQILTNDTFDIENVLNIFRCINRNKEIENPELVTDSPNFSLNKNITVDDIIPSLCAKLAEKWCSLNTSTENTYKNEHFINKIVTKCVKQLSIPTPLTRIEYTRKSDEEYELCLQTFSNSLLNNLNLSLIQQGSDFVENNFNNISSKSKTLLLTCIITSMISSGIVTLKDLKRMNISESKMGVKEITSNDAVNILSMTLAEISCSTTSPHPKVIKYQSIAFPKYLINCLQNIKHTKTYLKTREDKNILNISCSNVFFRLLYYNIKSSRIFYNSPTGLTQFLNDRYRLSLFFNCALTGISEFQWIKKSDFDKLNLIAAIFFKHNFTVKESVYVILDIIADTWCTNPGVNVNNMAFYATEVSNLINTCVEKYTDNSKMLIEKDQHLLT